MNKPPLDVTPPGVGAPEVFALQMTRSVRYDRDDGIRGIAVVVDAGHNTYEGFIEEKNGITYIKVRVLPAEGGMGRSWINKLGDGQQFSSLQHLHLSMTEDGSDLVIVCIAYDAAVTQGKVPYHNYKGRIRNAILTPYAAS